MDQLNIYSNITERDVDLLILEELLVSACFSNWFTSEVFGQECAVNTVGAWHSVSDPLLGESDLVFKFTRNTGIQEAILIENKIDAGAQSEQGARYQQRGDKGLHKGEWSNFKTCLLAPQRYLERNTELYDHEISYEQVINFFQTQSDMRSTYRASFLIEAVEKNRRGYQSVVCDSMTAFAASYLNYANINYPQLKPEMIKPRAAGHDWIHFYPLANQRDTVIVHQIRGQMIKVMYRGQVNRFDEISSQFSDFSNHPLMIKRSGKSVTVATKAPYIDLANKDFNDVIEQVRQTLEIAAALNAKLSL
ncbi:PD-(D/E)XK nuclease superfamily protein [Arsukibacterium ikkense]|uniref:PD-(D/E)XK nuclease superfamily protein n=1 Tax=Arsukibacterium ikkense TaxID=336831 RepID=A0A0M2V131_9GAMM|nr:PD-(D/E)XK nuclease superfamily protein [Arsukibacterium ikkense]KKO44306.1 PD-(D/E)XK nuclease superfamily protein [Arsukibacterium ikkense]